MLTSHIVFAIMEPGGQAEKSPVHGPQSNSDAIGFVLRSGGAAALIAGVLALRLARKHVEILGE